MVDGKDLLEKRIRNVVTHSSGDEDLFEIAHGVREAFAAGGIELGEDIIQN